MNILRASHLGMCFGVRDAVHLAFTEARRQPLTILGDLVHNESVVAALRARGIHTVNDLAAVATRTVMITAHGASDRAKRRVQDQGRQLLEATCPLVQVAHRAVLRLARDGWHPIIVGKRDHVEVRGLTEDLAEFDIVLCETDIAQLRERPRYGVAAQTTQPIDRVRHLVGCLRRRFPRSEVKFVDTVCQPTKQRQHAAVELAQRCDVVVVIGGANSNNTRELVATCGQYCARVHHVQGPADLSPTWFAPGNTVGVTAGTSTPDDVIDRVEARLQKWAAEAVQTSEAVESLSVLNR